MLAGRTLSIQTTDQSNPCVVGAFSARYMSNSIDETAKQRRYSAWGTRLADADSCSALCLLAGFGMRGPISSSGSLTGFGQAGVMFGWTPRIETSADGGAAGSQDASSGSSFGYGFSLLFAIKRFAFGVRVLFGKPKHNLGADNASCGDFEQPTSIIPAGAGLSSDKI